jgi:PKD repeat protein
MPNHTFGQGTYIVCNDIFDANQIRVCTYCDTLYVGLPSNNCFFGFFADAFNPALMNFSAAPAYPSSSIVWDFGDGSTGTGLTASNLYMAPGVYTVCMSELDSAGALLCQTCQPVTIGTTGNTCGFITRPDSINPFYIEFVAQVNITGYYTVNWTFGDNTSGTGYVGAHTYTNAGVYTVCMEAVDSLNNVLCTFCNNVAVTTSGGTNCNFTFSQTMGTTDVTFLAQGNAFNTYTWYSGSTGTSVVGNPVTITYPPGVNTDSICLVVTDANGTVLCTSCQYITLNNPSQQCLANFAAATLAYDAYFIDLSTVTTAATSFTWSFGDGTASNLRYPQHTYSAPGWYTVCLSIQDGNCQSSTCQQIFVDSTINVPLFCNAFFVVTQTSPFQLAVVNMSSGLSLSYMWDFGDGSTSNLIYPSHTYATSGAFNLCLTVSDSTGCTSTYCDSIAVDSLGRIIYRSATTGFSINVVSPSQMTTSVQTIAKDVSSSIYPNPATSAVRVQSADLKGSVNFRVMNIQGSEVLKGSMTSSSESIQVENLNPGMYMLELTDAAQNRVFGRFIKN